MTEEWQSNHQDELERDIAAVRRFNRFYTAKIGVPGEGFHERALIDLERFLAKLK
jgi:hypothetical protein